MGAFRGFSSYPGKSTWKSKRGSAEEGRWEKTDFNIISVLQNLPFSSEANRSFW